jgi:hypothetical protein
VGPDTPDELAGGEVPDAHLVKEKEEKKEKEMEKEK